jgi:hypothetical protein
MRVSRILVVLSTVAAAACAPGSSSSRHPPDDPRPLDAGRWLADDAGRGTTDSAPTVRPDGVYAVNIVDAAAEEELVRALTTGDGDGSMASRAFFATYPDEFDFLFMIPARAIPAEELSAVGLHMSVRHEAIPEIGLSTALDETARYGGARLKAVIAITFDRPEYTRSEMPPAGWADGPYLHELGHAWGVFLDSSFGFDEGWSASPSHWNWAGTHGILGGFDPSKMSCARPAGGALPCTAESNGRTQYVFDYFGPWVNFYTPYAMFELYLMGLADPDEIPTPISQLEDVSLVAVAEDSSTVTLEVEGIRQVSVADILRRHGTRSRSTETHFRTAFALFSSEPADPDMLEAVANRARILEGHIPEGLEHWLEFESFEGATRGRASMDTRISDAVSPAD